MADDPIEVALARRLPRSKPADRAVLAKAYRDGVLAHAQDRTTGTGSVPTNLSSERAELLSHVCRALNRLLTEDEVTALLRIPPTTGRSLRRTMLATFDDLPLLSLRSAFDGAKRDGRGSAGAITDGYRVKFATAEKLEIAQEELDRQGHMWELIASTGSQRILLLDSNFPVDTVLPGK